VQAFARAKNFGGSQAKDDGQRHRQRKKAQSRRPYAMHLLVGTQIGHPDNNRRKHQRHQHHAQQIEKQIADHFGAIQGLPDERRLALRR
jgi:hypothetical protein